MRFASQPVKLRIANVDPLRDLLRIRIWGFSPAFGSVTWSRPALAELDGEPPFSQGKTPQTLIYSR
jgi:hypothetical protein